MFCRLCVWAVAQPLPHAYFHFSRFGAIAIKLKRYYFLFFFLSPLHALIIFATAPPIAFNAPAVISDINLLIFLTNSLAIVGGIIYLFPSN